MPDPEGVLTIKVSGPAVAHGGIAFARLARLAEAVQQTLFRIGRSLAGAHQTNGPGRRPASIVSACTLELVSLEQGSVGLTARIVERPPDTLAGIHLGIEALEALGQSLAALQDPDAPLPRGVRDANLQPLCGLRSLLAGDLCSIQFTTRVNGRSWSSDFRADSVSLIEERARQDAVEQVEERGRLLMGEFRDTSLACRLDTADGARIKCTFPPEMADEVHRCLRSYVRVVGHGHYRRGKLRSVDLESIEILEDMSGLAFGTAVGASFEEADSLDELAARQGVRPLDNGGDLRADFWPKDEDPDEFALALRRWREEEA